MPLVLNTAVDIVSKRTDTNMEEQKGHVIEYEIALSILIPHEKCREDEQHNLPLLDLPFISHLKQ